MKTWVALLRGVNVGGRNRLPMKELVAALEAAGLADVRTYIQSGNVVFRATGEASALARTIRAAIRDAHGLDPHVLVLSVDDYRVALAANPFPDADPKTLHHAFLDAPPESPDLAGLDALRAPTERFQLIGAVFHLHAPDGIGRSRLAAALERKLGVPATGRNGRTARAILELADGV